jgi:hypothetical protein
MHRKGFARPAQPISKWSRIHTAQVADSIQAAEQFTAFHNEMILQCAPVGQLANFQFGPQASTR